MTDRKIRLLYVDDEIAYQNIFRREMGEDQRFKIEITGDGPSALKMLEKNPADIVLTDLSMPGMDGIELLKKIQQRWPDIFVLILTGVNSAKEAVRAMKAGAYDYILKPFDFTTLQMQLEKLLQHLSLLDKDADTEHMPRFEQLIGRTPSMYELFEGIRRTAATNATVLIRGESGTGKELVAAAVHARSSRRNRVFVPVNCASLTESLINSALFGHEKGAFSGADKRKIGFFEHADGGTIFLDEIGDIPITTQIALLRVLELGTFQRVGGTETIRVDTRIICATNKDLEAEMRAKAFREDLYYRLNVVTLNVPPLRERTSDIPLLTTYFFHKFSKQNNKNICAISSKAQQLLKLYHWPGNVRELANAIERAVIFCSGDLLEAEHLPHELRMQQPAIQDATTTDIVSDTNSLPEIEAAVIRKVLTSKSWNISHAAEALGIARGTLYGKIKTYRIEKD